MLLIFSSFKNVHLTYESLQYQQATIGSPLASEVVNPLMGYLKKISPTTVCNYLTFPVTQIY